MSGRTATKIKNFWNSHQRKDPQVCPRNPDGIGFGPASIPNASSIPAPVSASLEPSKADQAVKILEVTPVDQETFDWLVDDENCYCSWEEFWDAYQHRSPPF